MTTSRSDSSAELSAQPTPQLGHQTSPSPPVAGTGWGAADPAVRSRSVVLVHLAGMTASAWSRHPRPPVLSSASHHGDRGRCGAGPDGLHEPYVPRAAMIFPA